MRRFAVLTVLVPLLGCGDSVPQVDFGGEDLGPERFAVLSQDGDVKMGLTDDFVFFAVSDSVIADVRGGIRGESGAEEGTFLSGVLETVVGKALDFRARIPVTEIRDIRWADGAMRFEFLDADRRLGEQFQVDDEPVTEAFGEAEVRAFSEAFRQLTAVSDREPAADRRQ